MQLCLPCPGMTLAAQGAAVRWPGNYMLSDALASALDALAGMLPSCRGHVRDAAMPLKAAAVGCVGCVRLQRTSAQRQMSHSYVARTNSTAAREGVRARVSTAAAQYWHRRQAVHQAIMLCLVGCRPRTWRAMPAALHIQQPKCSSRAVPSTGCAPVETSNVR